MDSKVTFYSKFQQEDSSQKICFDHVLLLTVDIYKHKIQTSQADVKNPL